MLRILVTLSSVLLAATLFGQSANTTQIPIEVSETSAIYVGTTKPVRDLKPIPPISPERKDWVKRQRPPRNFVGRGMDYVVNPNALPQGEDPIRQKLSPQEKQLNEIPLLVNQQGVTFGGAPHDPSGDVGKDHYLQIVNATNFQVLNKDGSPASGVIAANTLWSTIGFSSAGDPIVLYDQEVDRWIITEFPSGNQLLFAISKSSDPMGVYDVYNFATPIFPDYPKYGIWGNAYVVTTNETGIGNQTSYFIDRQSMLDGLPTVPIQRIEVLGFNNGPGFFVATPVDWTGDVAPPADRQPMIVRQNDDEWGNTGEDAIDITSFNIDFDDASNSSLNTISVPVSPFDGNPCSATGPGFACIPQLNGSGIDGVPDVIMNQVHYLNFGTHESMVMAFITDVTGGDNLSGIRWIEMRRTATEDWSVYQEGTWSPDELDRFIPSIAMDYSGNISLAYSVASETEYVSLRMTARRAGDPLGEMTLGETTIVEGEAAINSFGRYADYAHLSIDPVDGRTFWFTSEYADANSVTSRVASWSLQKDTFDLAARSLITPQTGTELTATEVVTFEVFNSGLDTVETFDVGYIFQGGTPVVETVSFQLLPDSSYTHTFTPTVDMLALGTYAFELFVDFSEDEADFNNTLLETRSQLPRNDAGITSINGLAALNCSADLPVTVTLTNFSGLALNSVTINVEINGNTPTQIDWTGNLAPGESTEVNLDLVGLPAGEVDVNIFTSMPNNETDEVEENNGRTETITVDPEAPEFVLTIDFDDYPEDISWVITDENGTEFYTGGNYDQANQAVEIPLCLPADGCYTFAITDAFGDGFLTGGYEIVNPDDVVVVSDPPNFTSFDEAEFCDQFICNLEVAVDFAPASAFGVNDGMIMLTLSNTGGAEFMISIDGGVTFTTETTFDNLAAGTYDIIVTNGEGCEFTDQVVIEQPSSIVNTVSGQRFIVFPNPTNGVFRVELSGLENKGNFLPIQIFDAAGRLVQAGQIVRYDSEYVGQFSLTYEPNGTYFMRIDSDQASQLLRIVKK